MYTSEFRPRLYSSQRAAPPFFSAEQSFREETRIASAPRTRITPPGFVILFLKKLNKWWLVSANEFPLIKKSSWPVLSGLNYALLELEAVRAARMERSTERKINSLLVACWVGLGNVCVIKLSQILEENSVGFQPLYILFLLFLLIPFDSIDLIPIQDRISTLFVLLSFQHQI